MPSITASKLALALSYAARGWHVFPCHNMTPAGCSCGMPTCSQGKHPRVAGGFKVATTDPGQIAAWWSAWPDANIGIATGEVSGLVVVDIDPKDGGPASLVALEKQLGPLPSAIRSITGSGGAHIYMRHPGERVANSASKLGHGVDIRGDGGYVIAPGSDHRSGGTYRWNPDHRPDVSPLAEIPPAWLAALRTTNSGKTSGVGVAPVIDLTGKRIDGREERARDIRRAVFADLQDETGQGPTLVELAEESYRRFAAECATGTTARSDNSYDWDRWWRDCEGDLPRLESKFSTALSKSTVVATRPRLDLEEAEDELSDALSGWLRDGGHTVVRMTAGGGKTSAAVERISFAIMAAKVDDLRPPVVHWFSPDHRVAEETCRKFNDGPLVRAGVIQGRERAGCRDPAAVAAAVESGLPVQTTCCVGCKWFDECA